MRAMRRCLAESSRFRSAPRRAIWFGQMMMVCGCGHDGQCGYSDSMGSEATGYTWGGAARSGDILFGRGSQITCCGIRRQGNSPYPAKCRWARGQRFYAQRLAYLGYTDNEIVGQTSGVDQIKLNTLGQLVAGNNQAIVDGDGIPISGSASLKFGGLKRKLVSILSPSGRLGFTRTLLAASSGIHYVTAHIAMPGSIVINQTFRGAHRYAAAEINLDGKIYGASGL